MRQHLYIAWRRKRTWDRKGRFLVPEIFLAGVSLSLGVTELLNRRDIREKSAFLLATVALIATFTYRSTVYHVETTTLRLLDLRSRLPMSDDLQSVTTPSHPFNVGSIYNLHV